MWPSCALRPNPGERLNLRAYPLHNRIMHLTGTKQFKLYWVSQLETAMHVPTWLLKDSRADTETHETDRLFICIHVLFSLFITCSIMSHGEPPPNIYDHIAVRLEDFIIIFGGTTEDVQRDKEIKNVIWTYNIYIAQWRKYITPDGRKAPARIKAGCAVNIGSYIYRFGGLTCRGPNNMLWRLTRDGNDRFSWDRIHAKNKKEVPSPRYGHTGWDHDDKIWIFGGFGDPPADGYLNEHGDFVGNADGGYNNQLLCFDLSCRKWTNTKCFGAVPKPRSDHATAKIRDRVWLYRGLRDDCDMHEISMSSFVWTNITTSKLKPEALCSYSLTAITDNQIVLHGGSGSFSKQLNETWIYDIPSHSWRQINAAPQDHFRHSHAGITGLNNCVIMIGGRAHWNNDKPYNVVFSVMLEPKSLQHLAIQTVFVYKDELPLNTLPKKLRCKVMCSETDIVQC